MNTVTFNGVPAAPAFPWSNTSMTVSVPGNATSGNIVVTVEGEASNGVPFTVEPQPSITGMNPTSGPAGTVVTISGQNLLDAEGRGTVYLNRLQLSILNPTSTSLQVAVPAEAIPEATTGAFDVHINGVGRYTPIFTLPSSPTQSQITGLSAPYGAYYAVITLTGTNFGASQGSGTVFFSLSGYGPDLGVTAVPTAWSNTSITLHVPHPYPGGSVLANPSINDIVVNGSNAVTFTVEPTPSVTGISPTAGPPGTLVTISGQNLLDAGDRGEVWFGNIIAPIVSASSTSIQVKVPVGATTGPVDVHVNGVGNYTPVFTVSP